MTIEEFNETIRTCTLCRLSETRINAICGEGRLDAPLLFIAQAPGEVEDREGRMFLGHSGKVFFELLEPAGVGRDDFYMTNLIKCRLPKNRKPKKDEIAACSHYLDAEIARVKPKLIVPLGYYATRYIFDSHELSWPSDALFGTVRQTEGCRVYPLQHPAAMLHNPALKEEMAFDYTRLKEILAACG